MLVSLALLLAACKDSGELPPDDSVPVEESTAPDDSDEPALVDLDHDGSFSDVDCDDQDYQVFPGAPELCDGLDNDCDEQADEDFDLDFDGHLDANGCDNGDDCDDADPATYVGAEEIPYDAVDQDCDGEDLTDVDGDNFDAAVVGGLDCDDSVTAIHPGAAEIPRDGIDQDCDGVDDLDGDGDGFDAEELGGDDCDDGDASVHPGALDWSNDGIDANCDGDDDNPFILRDSSVSIHEAGTRSDLVGRGLDVCDLDEDGLGDLIVAAPFGNTSYNGQIGIWYGATSSTWTNGMTMSTADTLIQGGTYGFIGFDLACADYNGDGHMDLAIGRGEITSTSLRIDQAWAILLYYGDGRQFAGTLGATDADATLELPFVVPSANTVYSVVFHAGDADGDGLADIIAAYGNSAGQAYDGEDRVILLPGANYSGTQDMEPLLAAVLEPEQPYQISDATVLSDLDGDGSPDIAALSSGWTSDYGDSDSADTGAEYEGRVDFLSALDATASVPLPIDSTRYGYGIGHFPRLEFGYRLAEADFDGDGVDDLLISGLGHDTNGGAERGSLFMFSAAAVDLSGGTLEPASQADAVAYGDSDYAYLGYKLVPVGDVDGDGHDDVLVAEPGGGLSSVGMIYLLSGARLSGTLANVDDAALLSWQGDNSDSFNGFDLAGGVDMDGDGLPDFAIAASGWDSASSSSIQSGRVYVMLTTAL